MACPVYTNILKSRVGECLSAPVHLNREEFNKGNRRPRRSAAQPVITRANLVCWGGATRFQCATTPSICSISHLLRAQSGVTSEIGASAETEFVFGQNALLIIIAKLVRQSFNAMYRLGTH